ncbi:MAG: hypothetical protein LBP68_02400, partial [Acidobacteriota bacterium]|nr:hypothetical protein [Acidobacteriota bacterium]
MAFVGALVVIVAVLLVSPMLFNRGSRASASSVREIPTSSTGANVDMVVDKPGDEDYQGIGPVSELPTGTVIDGYPVARGQFNAKGELKAFYSSAPIEFHGDTLPTGTWIKLDADQRIATVVFPEDTTIQGYRIRGGYMDEVTVDSLGYEKWSGLSKILPWSATYFRLTRFHPNGTLELFSSREDVMVQNIPCMGSPLTGVLLWENGEL